MRTARCHRIDEGARARGLKSLHLHPGANLRIGNLCAPTNRRSSSSIINCASSPEANFQFVMVSLGMLLLGLAILLGM